MIEVKLTGPADKLDAAVHALVEAGIDVHVGNAKSAMGKPGTVLRYGTITPPQPTGDRMHDLGDLALALGGCFDSFTGQLLQLVVKAQATAQNYERLLAAFPRIVRAWEIWMATDPAPTAEQLLAALDAEGVTYR